MARRSLQKRWLALGATALILDLALAGCGGGAKAFVPASASAREALNAALSAWKNGEKPDSLAARTPAVHAVDTHWRNGETLLAYEVVKEEPGEGVQRLTARLTSKVAAAKAKETQSEVTYIVVGRDPVWVYRDDDYARLLGMEDNPRPGKGAAQPAQGRPSR
jgi:hypothetical protein